MTNNQCLRCEHYKGANFCAAYSDKHIPREIFMGETDHTKPFKGDNGIRFEPIREPRKS